MPVRRNLVTLRSNKTMVEWVCFRVEYIIVEPEIYNCVMHFWLSLCSNNTFDNYRPTYASLADYMIWMFHISWVLIKSKLPVLTPISCQCLDIYILGLILSRGVFLLRVLYRGGCVGVLWAVKGSRLTCHLCPPPHHHIMTPHSDISQSLWSPNTRDQQSSWRSGQCLWSRGFFFCLDLQHFFCVLKEERTIVLNHSWIFRFNLFVLLY